MKYEIGDLIVVWNWDGITDLINILFMQDNLDVVLLFKVRNLAYRFAQMVLEPMGAKLPCRSLRVPDIGFPVVFPGRQIGIDCACTFRHYQTLTGT